MPSAQPEKRTDKRTETHSCDLIDRQAAIDALELITGYHRNREPVCQIWYKAKDVYKVLNDLQSAQPEPQWTSSGKNPPEEGSYLVWMPFVPPKHRITVAEYCGGYWNIKTPISAWMPLPEPYKAERRTDG